MLRNYRTVRQSKRRTLCFVAATEQIVGRERNQIGCHSRDLDAFVVDTRRVNSTVRHLSLTMSDNIPVAVAYRLNGANFRASAEVLASALELDRDGRPTKLTAIPLYFLASYAAELYLKAALLKRGFDEPTLRKRFGHDLDSLLAALQQAGVSVTDETVATVKGLSDQHSKHALRYTVLVDDGKKTYWPPLSLVFSMLDELLLLTRISTQGV